MDNNYERERWKSKLGLILAMAGNAIGLGNFLRFPVQAASNGGGAFMIPYFFALIFMAIPIMWMEWAMGRLGGYYGKGSMPGIFSILSKHKIVRYLGVMGLLLPIGIVLYYTYIESWTLAYSFFSLTKKYSGISTTDAMAGFLSNFQGVNSKYGVMPLAYLFFLITFSLNIWILWGGISKGIERLAKIAMPLLFLFAIMLVIRIFTLPPDLSPVKVSIMDGLGFLWNPDLSKLTDASVWLSASGQIFFTTSIASGAIQTYASYVKRNEDIALSGLTTVMTNEFAEVILGGCIAIPVAYFFFGPIQTVEIAKSGAFNLGFVSMPIIFQHIPGGFFWGFLWFALLFFAGITSSVALIQPLITFLKDELRYSHKKAMIITTSLLFFISNVIIIGFNYQTVDELDFWIGTFGLSLFALIETILFVWIFGEKRAWQEITSGAKIKVPKIFLYILKYITPLYLLIIFIAWINQNASDIILMKNVASQTHLIWRWISRLIIIALTIFFIILIRKSEKMEAK